MARHLVVLSVIQEDDARFSRLDYSAREEGKSNSCRSGVLWF